MMMVVAAAAVIKMRRGRRRRRQQQQQQQLPTIAVEISDDWCGQHLVRLRIPAASMKIKTEMRL